MREETEEYDFSENITFIANDDNLLEPDKFLSGIPSETLRKPQKNE